MGVDAGWRLRFSRKDREVFWVRPEVVPQLENVLYVATDWTLELHPAGECLRAVYTRKARP
ncbi:MAG: hypothetical protein Q4B25_06080 [Pseudomonadota bacterium]|nr:hypothetical protein [Pseudomonadota bacterium]